jgi:2-octaprenyl-6-methoxyphenol hydroxylase
MTAADDTALTTEAAVIGGGPTGLTAALALAQAGVPTLLIAPAHRADNRTTALLAGSVAILDRLGVWQRCRDRAAALTAIRIIDDLDRLLRAPEVTFRAEEIELAAFGYNIANSDLLAALEAAAAQAPALRIVEAAAREIAPSPGGLTIRLADGCSVAAKLAVGADGRASLCRRAAGVAVEEWSYPQTALTCSLALSRPHRGISTEFHTAAGPFTLVPLGGNGASLVWVMSPADAARVSELDDDALATAIERQSHSIHGRVKVISGCGLFPLSGLRVQPAAARRIALVGEAAHLMPPIGAQGFNLGLRDVTTIAELAAAAHRAGCDIGAGTLLLAYEARRRGDIDARLRAVDWLNRSLLHDFLPVQGLRGLSLSLIDRIGLLRRRLMRAGVAADIM